MQVYGPDPGGRPLPLRGVPSGEAHCEDTAAGEISKEVVMMTLPFEPPHLAAPFVSNIDGALPHDGTATVGGVALPAGHRCRSLAMPRIPSTDVVWITDRVVPDSANVVRQLQASFPESGLWPLVIDQFGDENARPFDKCEFRPSATHFIDGVVLEEVFDDWWRFIIDTGDSYLVEYTGTIHDPALAAIGNQFPGFAPPAPSYDASLVHDRVAAPIEAIKDNLIALVSVARPADTLTVLGWQGVENHTLNTTEYSAALRSWEERFGAVVVGIGLDTLDVAVAFPPSDLASALPIAVEHFAFCPWNIWQGAVTIGAYAERLVDAPVWSFWWD